MNEEEYLEDLAYLITELEEEDEATGSFSEYLHHLLDNSIKAEKNKDYGSIRYLAAMCKRAAMNNLEQRRFNEIVEQLTKGDGKR